MPTALEKYYSSLEDGYRYLSLGCPKLDQIIGGISTQGITEIAGEAGAGKDFQY